MTIVWELRTNPEYCCWRCSQACVPLWARLLRANLRCTARRRGGCRALRLHGKNGEATDCFEALGRSGDAYLMAEGYWGLGNWEDAKKEFEVAIKQPDR